MRFKYFLPTKVFFGDNSLIQNKAVLKTLGRKALIVTGRRSAKMNGSFDDITKALSDLDMDYIVFDQVEENPSLETIEKASDMAKGNNVDFVIGVGGGSPMDAAKAIAIFIKNPKVNSENIFDGQVLDHIPVVAIPTTAGTGSEATPYSIVTSNKEKNKKNLGQVVFPSFTFIDSKYTQNLPYDITVSTSVDAFTHLVEGYLNNNANIMSDIYGEKGFELFRECFKNLIDKDLDEKFRDNVIFASYLGGIQIAQTGTSLPHGMGYPLTYFKGIPHGLANGVLTIEYLKIFKDKERIYRMLNLLGMSSLEELETILRKLIKLRISITEEEINNYAKDFYTNKEKLKNHTEDVNLEDIIKIYKNSLL